MASEQLLQGCKCMVDRHVGATLTAAAWKQMLKDPEGDPELTVRHLHGRADRSMRKVIERLLRFPHSDRNKEIQTTDTGLNETFYPDMPNSFQRLKLRKNSSTFDVSSYAFFSGRDADVGRNLAAAGAHSSAETRLPFFVPATFTGCASRRLLRGD